MLKQIGAAALKDITGMLMKEKSFFSADHDTRKAVIQKYVPGYPEALVVYLTSVSELDFMADIKKALEVFNGFSVPGNVGFLKALTAYISHDMGVALDQLNTGFFFMSLEERSKQLSSLFSDASFLADVSISLFLGSTYQEVTDHAYDAIQLVQDIPTIIIQTPLELNSEERKGIRLHFLEEYPLSFPAFQINPQLLGGMRILVEGKVMDDSWLSKIQAITSL